MGSRFKNKYPLPDLSTEKGNKEFKEQNTQNQRYGAGIDIYRAEPRKQPYWNKTNYEHVNNTYKPGNKTGFRQPKKKKR